MIKMFLEKEGIVAKNTKPRKRIVVCQKWEESERGWGTRPYGYSLHLTEEDRVAFCKKYWAKMPKDHIPDDYSREDGTPYSCKVNEEVFKEVNASRNGIWCLGTPPVGLDGQRGPDGWQ